MGDKRQALLCILAENCDEQMYKKLITGLCMEHGIPLIKVDSNMKLGEWSGLCKIDQEGKARKVVKCSCCVVRDWGKESPAHDVLQEYLKSQRRSADRKNGIHKNDLVEENIKLF